MAGSYNHCVTDQGQLLEPEQLADMLENGGDVYEAVEELFGMIWLLADQGLGDEATPTELQRMVKWARRHYKKGLEIARQNAGPKR